MSFSLAQLNQVWSGSVPWAPPAASGVPGAPTEVRVGDIIAPIPLALAVPGQTGYSGYPAVTSSTTVAVVGGVDQATPYTVQAGDLGKSIFVRQDIVNPEGKTSVPNTAATATVGALTKFGSLISGVVDCGGDYTFGWFTNAIWDSRGFGIQGSFSMRFGGSGTIAFSATSGACTATISGVIASALTGTSADIGRAFYFNSTSFNTLVATVTGAATLVSGTLNGTTGNGQVGTVTVPVTLSGNTANVVANQGILNWTAGLALDADGWPVGPSEVLVCSPDATAQQLANGTYWGQFTSTTQTSYIAVGNSTPIVPNQGTVQSVGGVTIDNVTQTGPVGGVYTTTYRIQSAASTLLWFSGPIQSCVLNRTTGLSGYQAPAQEFWPPMVAHHAQFNSVRMLGFNNAIGSIDTTWSSRIKNTSNIATHFNGAGERQYAWEVAVRMLNALYASPNSKLTKAWFQTGYAIRMQADGATLADDYGVQFGNLLNSAGLNAGIQVEVEISNEQWNDFSRPDGYSIKAHQMALAQADTQMVTNQAFASYPAAALLTNLTSNGTTATATVSSLPSWLQVGQTYNNCFISSSDAGWSKGSPTSPISVTVASATTLTWPTTQTTGLPISTANPVSIYFNATSDLLAMNQVPDMVTLAGYYYTRTAFRFSQSLKTVRPQDKVKLCLQQFGTTQGSSPSISNGGSAKWSSYFLYGDFLGVKYLSAAQYSGLAAWCYSVAVAPYIALPPAAGALASPNNQAAALTALFGSSTDNTLTSLWGALNLNTAPGIRALAYMTKIYNVRMQAYEANLDIQQCYSVVGNNPAFQASITGGVMTVLSGTTTPLTTGHVLQDNVLNKLAGLTITGPASVGSVNADGTGTYAISSAGPTYSAQSFSAGVSYQYQVPLVQDARAGQIITALMDIWFASGGKEFHLLDASPNPWVNGKNCWSIVGDTLAMGTTSPRLQAALNYGTPVTFFNDYLNQTTIKGDISKATMTTVGATLNAASNPPMFWRNGGSAASMYVDFLLLIPRAGRYTLTPVGLTTVAGEVADVYLDGVTDGLVDNTTAATHIGTMTMPVGVSPGNAGANAQQGTTLTVALTAGRHIVSYKLRSGQGGFSGIATITAKLANT